MRELRNIRDKRYKRRHPAKGRRLWLIIIAAAVAGTGILLTVSKVKTRLPKAGDLTPGKIYTKESKQKEAEVPSQNAETPATEGSRAGDSATPESFTFYKVLNKKEDIVPLENMQKPAKKEGPEIKTPRDEKMSQIEKEVEKNIEKNAPKNEIYTVQVAALGSESAVSEVISKLKSQGYAPYVFKEDEQRTRKLYKIRVGKFLSIVDAQEVAKVLKKDGYDTYVIKTE